MLDEIIRDRVVLTHIREQLLDAIELMIPRTDIYYDISLRPCCHKDNIMFYLRQHYATSRLPVTHSKISDFLYSASFSNSPRHFSTIASIAPHFSSRYAAISCGSHFFAFRPQSVNR